MIQKDQETIAAQVQAAKDSVQNTLKLKSVNVKIWSSRNSIGEFGYPMPFKLRRGKADGELARFFDALDKTVADKFVTAVKVTVSDSHNTPVAELIVEKFAQDGARGGAEVIRPKERAQAGQGEAATGVDDFARQFLSLMGVDADGVRDAKGALYTVALNFNKQNMQREFSEQKRELELEYERRENERRIAEAEAHAAEVERRIAQMEAEGAEKDAQIERLEAELEKAGEAYRQLEKADPTNVRLGSALAIGGQMLLRSNADKLGRLLNIPTGALTGLFGGDGPDEGDGGATVPAVDVEEQDDDRGRHIAEMCAAVRKLGDADFERVYKSVMAFAQNAEQGGGAPPAVEVEEQ